ncbi:carboxyltransferase domain-containing protein [Vibrio kanaloae]|uniref:Carboxyltransferase domain-containing protein n=1 Tax=Vibrio kanaloae TaxID=170673 RepID=A0A4U2BUU8_9VIBR|nr:carboxyltransferase domain-containing protein [Vibrio kanaloae]KAB0465249.1 carboxyltransferase domain-containing protein [Vibrio kanaloae]NOI01959.1 carboxyltransferase domain-containing protein [Vibrio kanaloae]TKF01872.1 carboxyltransferase domain-containing protein [Vibrio kanaloae]TKF31615.1 carboxyltransferase domain-containing protein [Vibrio kanaloae]TKF66230.1 carboxyltransferase domain-containing protein [Vibrio kanaloae]
MTKNQIEFNIEPVAECSVLVTLIPLNPHSSAIDAQYMAHFSDVIRQNLTPVLMNVTPAYHTILVDYLPYRISEQQLITQLSSLLTQALPLFSNTTDTTNIIELPAYYASETALDLGRYQEKGLSLDDIIQYHTSETYSVSAIGFIPGFAFMSDVVSELALPRHSTPRLSVPKGSIAIADSKTAVYPSDSPGGWNIIGNCPLSLFSHSQLKKADITPGPLSLLNVGDSVRFKSISKQEFMELRSMEISGGGAHE